MYRCAGSVTVVLSLAFAAGVLTAQDEATIGELRLSRLEALNAAGETDVPLTNAVLGTKWPEALRARAFAALNEAIESQPEGTKLGASSVRFFVLCNDEAPPALRRYLLSALPKTEPGDKVMLLNAIRVLRGEGAEFESLVRSELANRHDVVQIVAASTLLAIDPDDAPARRTLKRFLRDHKNAEMLWRAADGAGHSGLADDEELLARLDELLSHEDVRVRTTAAAATWRLTKQTDAALPVLREAMQAEDQPLAVGFVYPSDQGSSHRMHILHAFGEMRTAGAPVESDLIAAIEDCAFAESPSEHIRFEIGLTAIGVLASSGPVSDEILQNVRALASQERSTYQLYPEMTETFLARLETAKER